MPKKTTIKIKHPILQMICRHNYQYFEEPIDRETNPYGFVSLNGPSVTLICTKCGKVHSRYKKKLTHQGEG